MLLCWIAGGPGPVGNLVPQAQAGKPRCRLERVDASQLDKSGQLRVLGSITEVEGTLAETQSAKEFRLLVSGKVAARGEKAEPFERSGQEMFLVLAVEISALYAPSVDQIKEALHEFLEALPRTKVKLILFGADLEPSPGFLAPGAALQQIDELNPDDQGEVQLLNALSQWPVGAKQSAAGQGQERQPAADAAQGDGGAVRRAKPADGPARRSGALGDLLRQNGVPLFPVAFSPRDDRGPLLNLGELAKRSSGTFRWAQKDDGLKEQFQNLAEELNKTSVLSFSTKKLDTDKLGAATYALQCGGELKSAPFILSGVPEPKPSRWWKWLLGILLSLVALWGLAQAALWLLNRRSQKLGLGPPGTGVPPPGGVPGGYAVPPGAVGYVPPGNYQTAGTLPVGYPGAGRGGYAAGTLPPGRVYTGTLIGIGPLGGQRIKVEASLSLGAAVSGPASFAISGDPTIGPLHCELRRDPSGFTLVDAGTAAGSFINDRRVTGAARLSDGDLIRLGEGTQFKFRIDD